MTNTGKQGVPTRVAMSQQHSHEGVMNMDVCATVFTFEFSPGAGPNSSTMVVGAPLDPADFSALIVTIMLSFIVGIMGNSLALGVLYKMRSNHSEMRKSVFYVLVEGLVWTDLLGILLTAPITIITYVMYPTKWLCAHPHICKFGAFAGALFGIVTPLIICTMAIERLFSINYPYTFSVSFTQSKAKLSLIACWGIGLFVASLPLMGFGKYELQYPHMWCFLNWHAETPLDTAYALTYASINVLTMLTLVVSSVTVIVTLLKMRTYRRSSVGSSRQFSISKSPDVAQKQREVELQMVWFLVGIMFVYVVCWSPLIIQIIANSTVRTKNYDLDVVAIRLACLNQILDPWVYILLRRRCVRKSISIILTFLHLKRRRRIRRPPTHLRQGMMKCSSNLTESPFVRKLSGSQESGYASSDTSKTKDTCVKPFKRLLYASSPGDCRLSCVYETVHEISAVNDIPTKALACAKMPKPFSYPFNLNAVDSPPKKYRRKYNDVLNWTKQRETVTDNNTDIRGDISCNKVIKKPSQEHNCKIRRASSLVSLEENSTLVRPINFPKDFTDDSSSGGKNIVSYSDKKPKRFPSEVSHLNIMSMYTAL